jgi:hypothetical protein
VTVGESSTASPAVPLYAGVVSLVVEPVAGVFRVGLGAASAAGAAPAQHARTTRPTLLRTVLGLKLITANKELPSGLTPWPLGVTRIGG